MEKPQIILHAENALNYTVFDTKWIPVSTKFIALGTHTKGTGALQIYEIASGKVNLVTDVRKLLILFVLYSITCNSVMLININAFFTFYVWNSFVKCSISFLPLSSPIHGISCSTDKPHY